MGKHDNATTDRAMRDQGPLLSRDQEAELAQIIVKEAMGAIKRPAAEKLAEKISEIAGIYRSAGEHTNVVVSALLEHDIGKLKPEILAKNIAPFLDRALSQQDASASSTATPQKQKPGQGCTHNTRPKP